MGGSSDVEQETRETLELAAHALEDAAVPADVVGGLHALAGQVGEPCVVAVVGQVKAGKSSFINALLGEDHAVVGTTETTATINHFSYGEPDPRLPVRCHWRGGRVTEEGEEFLAGLQANDLETLRRAEGIDRLEYPLPIPLLKEITLVDTPGTGAVVAEHESRTTEFLEVNSRLRQRHDEETRQIRASADAIVHLVGPVARTGDRELLERFAEATGADARASSALGVIAKIDMSDELIARRNELAAKVADQLSASLTTVLPVSAALARIVDRLRRDGGAAAERLIESLRPLQPDQLDLLLADEQLFLDYPLDECPLDPVRRRELREAVPGPWRVFVTLARIATGGAANAASLLEKAEQIAGFRELHQTLGAHFLERGHILRCFRIARDARAVLNRIRFQYLPESRRRARDEQSRLDRFLAFIAAAEGDPDTGTELEEFVRAQLSGQEDAAQLEALWTSLDAELGRLLLDLGEHSADFAALQVLDASIRDFSDGEVDELRALLGMYGERARSRLRDQMNLQHCIERQLDWRRVADSAAHGSARQVVARRAHDRLGLLIAEIDSTGQDSASEGRDRP